VGAAELAAAETVAKSARQIQREPPVAVAGHDAVLNLVARPSHRASERTGVEGFVQLSALGVSSRVETDYFRAKRLAERVVAGSCRCRVGWGVVLSRVESCLSGRAHPNSAVASSRLIATPSSTGTAVVAPSVFSLHASYLASSAKTWT
jgi:hypothetical protein